MCAPVGRQLHLLRLGVRLVGAGHQQPGEGIRPCVDIDHEPVVGRSLDDEIRGGREVRPALPVREQIDVTARPVAHAVLPNGIASGERESIAASGCAKSDLGQLPVTWIHAGDLTRQGSPTRSA